MSNWKPMPRSNKLCECGCGEYLTVGEVKAGRRFAQGHKKAWIVRNRKLVECACGCGKQFWDIGDDGYIRKFAKGHWAKSEAGLANMSEVGKSNLGIPKEPEHRAKLAARNKERSGPKNPNWHGGVWRDRPKDQNWYPDEFNNELKEHIRALDNHQCRMCKRGRIKLYVHHIDLNRENNADDNLISLCSECHFGKVHNGQNNPDMDYWIPILKKLILEREEEERSSLSLYLF